MEPSHIPVTNLCKADLMRTELLIWAHEKQLAQHVKQLYNMDVHIYTSTTEALSFHVHIHLWHITTQEQSNTVKCLCPGSDIMEHLEENVYNEILELNTHILDTLPEEETAHSWSTTLQSFKAKRLKFMNFSVCVLKDGVYVTKYFFVLK